MKVTLIQALYRNDIRTVYHMFLNPTNYMLLHDTMVEQLTPEQCYYYIKALKLANLKIFMDFAAISANSKHGFKRLFFIVLSIYNRRPHNLKDCHSEADGIQPELTRYADIARSIF